MTQAMKDLAIAWVFDEVSTMQVASVINSKKSRKQKTNNTGGNVYSFICMALRAHLRGE